MEDEQDYILHILSDSALPTGGFIASSALEAYNLHYPLSDRDGSLLAFIKANVSSFVASSLPFLIETHTDPSRSSELDGAYEATLTNDPVRRASRAQGTALITLYIKAFVNPHDVEQDADLYAVQARKDIRTGKIQGHLPICFGIMTRALNLDRQKAVRLYVFLHARNLLSAAVRLNLIGPYLAQRMLLDLYPFLRDLISQSLSSDTDINRAHQNFPLLEIMQARHDRLYSRLFNS